MPLFFPPRTYSKSRSLSAGSAPAAPSPLGLLRPLMSLSGFLALRERERVRSERDWASAGLIGSAMALPKATSCSGVASTESSALKVVPSPNGRKASATFSPAVSCLTVPQAVRPAARVAAHAAVAIAARVVRVRRRGVAVLMGCSWDAAWAARRLGRRRSAHHGGTRGHTGLIHPPTWLISTPTWADPSQLAGRVRSRCRPSTRPRSCSSRSGHWPGRPSCRRS